MSRYSESLEERYRQQERQARHRGIGWEFTFESWHQLWLDSGKLHLRGKGSGKFVLGRRGDVGPYSVGNCDVIPFEQNIRDGRARCKVEKPPKPRKIPRGWTYRNKGVKRFQVMVGPRYVGVFATQAEAELAYAIATGAHVSGSESVETAVSIFHAPQGYSTGFKNHAAA